MLNWLIEWYIRFRELASDDATDWDEPGEPCLLIRGSDPDGPDTVRLYSIMAAQHGLSYEGLSKLLDLALRMEDWQRGER